MKRLRLFILILFTCAAALLSFNCDLREPVYGNGDVTTVDYSESDFDRLSVVGVYSVNVVQGAAYAVSVTTDTNIAPLLEVHKEGACLVLDQNDAYNLIPTVLEVTVTMPSFAALSITGDIEISCSGFSGAPLSLQASGLSQIVFSNGNASSCSLVASGDTTLTMATGFTLSSLTLNVTGDTQIVARMDGTGGFSGMATGDTRINYYGTPASISVNATGFFNAAQLE